MNDILRLILSLSLSGSILALILFAVKPYVKHRLPKSVQYYIWIIVLLRLTLPFSFEESIINKVFNNSIEEQRFIDRKIRFVEEEIHENSLTEKGNDENKADYADVSHGKYLQHYLYYIYIIGVFTALYINIRSYLKFLRLLQFESKETIESDALLLNSMMDSKKKVQLLRNPLVNIPMLVGIFQPKIIIPDQEYDEEELKHILRHEIVHLKHFDIGIKWFLTIVKSVHWFNPMVYIIGKEINTACELACDEAVIRGLDNRGKQSYGDTLISIASGEKGFSRSLQVTMSADKNILKERLMAIMNYRGQSKKTMLISIFFIVVVILGSLYLGAGMMKDMIVVEEESIPLVTIEMEEDSWDIKKESIEKEITEYFIKAEWVPVEMDMEELEELQKETYYEGEGFIATTGAFVNSLGFDGANLNRIQIDHNGDHKVIRYEFEEMGKIVEMKIVQPIEDGFYGIWAINGYRILDNM